jgi:hypothetical protein
VLNSKNRVFICAEYKEDIGFLLLAFQQRLIQFWNNSLSDAIFSIMLKIYPPVLVGCFLQRVDLLWDSCLDNDRYCFFEGNAHELPIVKSTAP